MPVGLSFALIALAQAASAAAPTSTAPAPPAPDAAAAKGTTVPTPDRPDGCEAQPRGDSRTIVVCAPKPQGYRIDPDVLEARREARNRGHTQPQRPAYQTMQVNNCATVGPMGCRGGFIDLLSAAGVLGQMAQRAVEGQNVGQMFVTEPSETEYQLYVDAKKRREVEEAKAAAAKAKAAALAPKPAPPITPPQTGPSPTATPAHVTPTTPPATQEGSAPHQ
jgi:hypothetical protein